MTIRKISNRARDSTTAVDKMFSLKNSKLTVNSIYTLVAISAFKEAANF